MFDASGNGGRHQGCRAARPVSAGTHHTGSVTGLENAGWLQAKVHPRHFPYRTWRYNCGPAARPATLSDFHNGFVGLLVRPQRIEESALMLVCLVARQPPTSLAKAYRTSGPGEKEISDCQSRKYQAEMGTFYQVVQSRDVGYASIRQDVGKQIDT